MTKIWAQKLLSHPSLGKVDSIESVAVTPYSEVDRVTASGGVYYLKKTPAPLFIEAAILRKFHGLDPSFPLPELAAADAGNLCFLTRSCGEETLRTVFARRPDLPLLAVPVAGYKAMQNAAIPVMDEFIALGVPDWRLSRLPELYKGFARNEAALLRHGLDANMCGRLREAEDSFAKVCARVASYGIPDTINHSDFQENNMVLDAATGRICIIDWGEVTVSHALWSAAGCFKKLCWRYKIPPKSEDRRALLRLFMGGWGLKEGDMPEAFENISVIDWIYYALSLAELEKNTGHPSPEWSLRIKMACGSFMEEVARTGA